MKEKIRTGSKIWGNNDVKDISVPVSIFRDRRVTVFERLIEYLRDEQNLRYCKIAVLLNRDQRTIYTVYKRVQVKREQDEANTS